MWPFKRKADISVDVSLIPSEKLCPGDLLLVRYSKAWGSAAAERMCEYLKAKLPEGVRIAALPDDARFQLFKCDPPPKDPGPLLSDRQVEESAIGGVN